MHCDFVLWVLGTVAALDVLLGWPTYPATGSAGATHSILFLTLPACLPLRIEVCYAYMLCSHLHRIISSASSHYPHPTFYR